jgi:SAM-dependent methyltransferase
VWRRLEAAFRPGDSVLELACGTGEDARCLAARGIRVVATDQSDGMLAVTRDKTAGLPVVVARLDLLYLPREPAVLAGAPYSGVFSNFGGLNALPDYRPLAAYLAPLVRPGGRLVFVVMGRWCAWEIAWHLAHGQPGRAFRRLRSQGARARVGAAEMAVYYPSTAALRQALAPHFCLERAQPLGLLLPPSYLEPLTRRRYFPWRLLAMLDRRMPWPRLADHTLYEWVRI